MIHRVSFTNASDQGINVETSTKYIHITKTRVFKYIENFTIKNRKFSDNNFYVCYSSAQNIDCEYSLEPVQTSTHNLCFWAEIREIMYTSVNPSFTISVKAGFEGIKIIQVCFRDESPKICHYTLTRLQRDKNVLCEMQAQQKSKTAYR